MERNQLRAARQAANMSQSELAKRLSELVGKTISRQYINQLEDSTNTKTTAKQERLDEIAGIIEKAATLNRMAQAAWQK